MHAIVSLLDGKNEGRVFSMWRELEIECELPGVKITPIPHFSWQIAEDYHFDGLEHVLEEMAFQARPFSALANGLALFTGEDPVVYIPIVRNLELSSFHQTIWERTIGLSKEASPHYAPQVWLPHITLAHGGVNLQQLHCLMDKYAHKRNNWDLQINNLAVISQPDGQEGVLKKRFEFPV